MSRSTFLTTNEVPTTNYHNGLITTNSIVVSSKPPNISNNRINPRFKKYSKDKRRSTGIRSNDVSSASVPTEDPINEDDAEEQQQQQPVTDSNDLNQTLTSPKPMFSVNVIQSSFENLAIARAEPSVRTTPSTRIFLPEEFRLHRVDKQTSIDNDDSSTYKSQQLEERVLILESILHEKDNIIHDLQHKLDITKQDLIEAEQQIYKLHQDKLTLIKAFATIQENKPPPLGDHLRRYSRN